MNKSNTNIIYGIGGIAVAGYVGYKCRKIHRVLVETGTYTTPGGHNTFTKNGLDYTWNFHYKRKWVYHFEPPKIKEK